MRLYQRHRQAQYDAHWSGINAAARASTDERVNTDVQTATSGGPGFFRKMRSANSAAMLFQLPLISRGI